jgi:hypothetical protein
MGSVVQRFRVARDQGIRYRCWSLMGQGPRIPKETWDAVKVAYLAGLSTKEIAQQFELEEQTVATKVCKAGWNKIIREAVKTVKPNDQILKRTADILEMDWKSKGAGHRAHVFKIAHEALKRSSLPAPRSWKDAQIADNMARKAVGLDEEKGANAIVNIGWMQSTLGGSAPAVDNEIFDVEFERESVSETEDAGNSTE